MSEITTFALVVLLVSGGLLLALAATRAGADLPIPMPVVFLAGAAAASDLVPSLGDALSTQAVERVAVVALVVVLFNGGLDIGWRRMRASLGPVVALGVGGTFITAGLVAGAAHWGLGFDWTASGLVGAALAPTDPAVVFSILGGRDVPGRAGTVLEGEAGLNDPAGIALMLGIIELATHRDATGWVVVEDFAISMVGGLAVGLLAARGLVGRIGALRRDSTRPLVVLVGAGALYAVTSLIGGSGFLAVFVAGLFAGDATDAAEDDVVVFSSTLASLAEIAVFVLLGLTVHISGLSTSTWVDGLALAAFLALVARPVAVAATLWPSRLSRPERLFIAWTGLKGAVPILLAAFAIVAGAPGAQPIYGLVFIVVLLSVLGQGSLVPWVARRLARAEDDLNRGR